ncbi:MAG: hypothetical protein AAGG08_19635 [Actinomycetota bacterium]
MNPAAPEPFRAAKRCRLGLVEGRPALRPALRGTFFGPTDSARCGEGHDHRVPDPDCTCGFYALADGDELAATLGPWRPEEAELDVELSGRVVRHERGFRGEFQTVLGVRLHPLCALCRPRRARPTAAVGRIERSRQRADWDGLVPLCDRCASRAPELWTVPGLAAALGTEVTIDQENTNAEPSRQLTRRSRALIGAAAVVAVSYLGLGLFIVSRGGDDGSVTADDLMAASVTATAINAAISGDEQDAAEVRERVANIVDVHFDGGGPADIEVDIYFGVDVAATVGGVCILATQTPFMEGSSVRAQDDGTCLPEDARALRP